MGWSQTLSQTLEKAGKFLAQGGHAQQDIPGQHRLLNAGSMFIAWWAMDQIRHIAFGVKMKSEGEYVEIKREDVPEALRFLHKAIEWDPYSETSENQWKKLAYQLIPGVGAGIGATMGSIYAFNRNGREQEFKKLKGLEKLNLLDADFAAEFAQSTPLRVLAGFFGTFSAASGLTFMYGFFLNPAFATANGARIFSGSLAEGSLAPHKAAPAQLEMIGSYVQDALKSGKMSDAWAKQFSIKVLEPLFGHELRTPEAQAKAVKTLQTIVEESFNKFKANGKPAKEIAEAVTKDLTTKLGKGGLDKTLKEFFGLDPLNATPGNANSVIYQFHNFLSSLGLGKAFSVGPQAKEATSNMGGLIGLGAAGAVLGVGTLGLSGSAKANEKHANAAGGSSAGQEASVTLSPDHENNRHKTAEHEHPLSVNQTPEQYVKEARAIHNAQYGNQSAPPDMLKWMGEGQLSVLPINRISCAVGLTTGLMVAGNLAKIATGFGLDGKAVDASKIPTYLEWMKGIVKDYNPKGLRPRDRWIKYAQWAAYSAGGLLGVRLGTEYAYQNVYAKNRDPNYLEDFLPRVSMHQGNTWGWLAASSAIFGSASGLWPLPVPGLNYGVGLAGRATAMQDRNFMLPGINSLFSGATTTSFLRVREGMNYLCHYAAGNPSRDPIEIEYLAYTLLGPVFKDKLTAEHIQEFTEAVHKVRDKYWQEGGIPKEKRKEAYKNLREVFSGAGLEILLIDMGLNPGTVKFTEMNGLTGTLGNIGITEKINKEQSNYQHALQERLTKYVSEGLISEAQAKWVKDGIKAVNHGKPAPEPLHEEKIATAEIPSASAGQEPQTKYAEQFPSKKRAFQDLIDKSEMPGDWRRKAHLAKEQIGPIAVGE
jgi:hypothetical protein